MKIHQDHLEFKPIILTLENQDEARQFLEIIDSYCDYFSDQEERFENQAYGLAVKISDAFTNCEAEIPNEKHC